MPEEETFQDFIEFVKKIHSTSNTVLTTQSNFNLKDFPIKEEDNITFLHKIYEKSKHVV